MLTILAFLLALGVLIAVHEYGHYRMAVACGVRVLRFSVGFGQVVWRWQPKGSATEFVLAAFPIGGYVRMLDEREAPVDAAERAFTRLMEAYFDFNEVRVTTVAELAETLHDLPDPAHAALSLRRALQGVFE